MKLIYINKEDVLHKHPLIFKLLVWTNGKACAGFIMGEDEKTYTSSTVYLNGTENAFLEIPKSICQLVEWNCK